MSKEVQYRISPVARAPESGAEENQRGKAVLYAIKVKFGAQEWTVYRTQDEFVHAGLKEWAAKLSSLSGNEELSFSQDLLASASFLYFLDPTIEPPAYGIPNATKSGWLTLQRTLMASKRWAVVSGGNLYLYSSEKSTSPLQAIDLVQYSIDEHVDKKTKARTKFDLVGVKDKFHFECDSESDLRDWITSCRKSRDHIDVRSDNSGFRFLHKELNKGNNADRRKSMLVDFAANAKINVPELKTLEKELQAEQEEEAKAPDHERHLSLLALRNATALADKPADVQDAARNVIAELRLKLTNKKDDLAPVARSKKPTFTATATTSQKTASRQSRLSMTSNDEAKFDEDGDLEGATFAKLLQLALQSPPPSFDPKFADKFLLTFPYFGTSAEMFGYLDEEWSSLADQKDAKSNETRTRIKTMLIRWLEMHYEDFAKNDALSKSLLHFIQSNVGNGTLSQADANWIQNIVKYQSGMKQEVTRQVSSVAPVLPHLFTTVYVGYMDLEPLEIARQLTLQQMEVLAAIPMAEFIGQKWNKSDKKLAAHVRRSIERFNKISNWASMQILRYSKPEQRAQVIMKLIEVTNECVKLRNYETVVQLISAIQSLAITRMKLTWEHVHDKAKVTLNSIADLFSPMENWKKYRATLNAAELPAIPYLGLYLQTLTFCEDGNPSQVEGTSLLNWPKFSLIGDVLMGIDKFRHSHYPFKEVADIRKLFDIDKMTIIDEDDMYNISLDLEPRNAASGKKTKAAKLEMQKELQKQQKEEFKKTDSKRGSKLFGRFRKDSGGEETSPSKVVVGNPRASVNFGSFQNSALKEQIAAQASPQATSSSVSVSAPKWKSSHPTTARPEIEQILKENTVPLPQKAVAATVAPLKKSEGGSSNLTLALVVAVMALFVYYFLL